MSPLQKKICDYIQSYIQQHGYSPTLTEIAAGIGISPKSISLISRNIHALVASGNLVHYKKGYRNIQPTESSSTLSLPLVGRIAAGNPIEAIENKQSIDLGAMLQGDGHYMLEVRGDSMIDEGILDGDWVICRQADKAREGEIVVALVDEQEATLKRVSYKVPERVTLIPANPNLKPKAYLPQRVQVQGIFVGLLRLKM